MSIIKHQNFKNTQSMKRTLLLISFFSVACLCFSQKSVTWKYLSKVKWHTTYVADYEGYYDLPRFSESIKDLNGKSIRIKGYYIPVDSTARIIALASKPSEKVFISNGKCSESVIELIPKDGELDLVHVKQDKIVEIKGVLVINKDDPNRLMYTVKKAELVASY